MGISYLRLDPNGWTLGVTVGRVLRTVYLTEGKASEPERMRGEGARIWSPNFKDLSQRNISMAKSLGLKIVAWTVNEPADIAAALDLGIDGIISDYPDRVLAELKRRGAR